jgi:nicotinate phosphoribosyltransferase
MITTRKRLDPSVFDLPVEKMRAGYYTDAYFNHTRETLRADGLAPQVVMQVFQKRHAYLGGMDEALAILKLCADDWDTLKVHALYDGDVIEPYETVLTIEGDYTTFAHLETVYLGTLARRTLITTNVVRVLEATGGKPLIFMPARHDHHRVQTGDGYAAYMAGEVVGVPIGVTTDEQASWWGGQGLGTVPHALISSYGGDTVAAAKHFADWAPPEMNVTVLVDFDNDSVATALAVARALGPRLWGVRLDTSESLIDRSLWDELGDFTPTGVNPRLVWKVRAALDGAGFGDVKIVVSGGFTVDKIREFESLGVPVDAYGVGSSLIRGCLL